MAFFPQNSIIVQKQCKWLYMKLEKIHFPSDFTGKCIIQGEIRVDDNSFSHWIYFFNLNDKRQTSNFEQARATSNKPVTSIEQCHWELLRI